MSKLAAWRGEVFRTAEVAASKAAVGQQGNAARAALAITSGIEQAALGEALDAVIEIINSEGNSEMGHVGIGGKEATLNLGTIADTAAAKHPVSRWVQRSMIEVVELPISELKLAAMSPAEFERLIRQHTSAGMFAAHGLPKMTVLDAKLHGGGHGYDGLGISKQGNLIQLYNLECKHVLLDSDHLPALGTTRSGTQGGLQWNESKARLMLSGANPYADETLEDVSAAIRKRVGQFDERLLEDTLADALKAAKFYAFTPVWAKTEHLLAQMRGMGSGGLQIGKLIRVAPRLRR
jgi:hypothetical protein